MLLFTTNKTHYQSVAITFYNNAYITEANKSPVFFPSLYLVPSIKNKQEDMNT